MKYRHLSQVGLICATLLATTNARSPLQYFFGNKDAARKINADSSLFGKHDDTPPIVEEDYIMEPTAETFKDFADVQAMYPEAMAQAVRRIPPKRHHHRPDSSWDKINRGHELKHAMKISTADSASQPADDVLNAYSMRSKSASPASLGVDPGVKQISGYLDDDENDKHLFYWFFESRGNPETDPVVLWLNGGPGCSSLTGLFFELGPASINKSEEIVFNPYSWNSNASVIFLDQPVNVGYSYSSKAVSNTVAAGKDVYALLELFFHQYPQYAHQDFHIAGESYAGHYIPVFATEILKHEHTNINLKSLLIGNGLTDALNQYPAYRPMACGEGGWPAVVKPDQCQAMDDALPRCLSLIESCYSSGSVWSCVPASIYCNNAIIGPYQRTGQNPYDVRRPCGDNPLCYDGLDDITKFLNKPAVMHALGAEVESYDGCNFDINRNFLFQGDWMQPFHRLVPELLKKLPVLIYAGDADFICNWLGNSNWTDALDWYGSAEYRKVGLTDLHLGGVDSVGSTDESKDGKIPASTTSSRIGQVKSSGNLTYMRIHGAGHMVPTDQPENSLDFFNRWLRGEWMNQSRH